MAAYLIQHTKAQTGDMLIQDDALTLSLTGAWARFTDQQGIVLVVPIERIASIERVDEPQDQEPAPQKE